MNIPVTDYDDNRLSLIIVIAFDNLWEEKVRKSDEYEM